MTLMRKKHQRTKIQSSLVKCYIIPILWLSLISCSSCKKISNNTENLLTTPSGLAYRILKTGTGPKAKEGQEVTLTEKVKFLNGSLAFPDKVSAPYTTVINEENLIKGVREGVTGMQAGEIRELIVPPSLSQRSAGHNFPYPDSTLVYEIELVSIVREVIRRK